MSIDSEKLSIVLDGLEDAVNSHPNEKFRQGGHRVLSHIRDEIASGQLDADCPKCPKCNDTGSLHGAQKLMANGDYNGYYSTACDCPAGTGGSEK